MGFLPEKVCIIIHLFIFFLMINRINVIQDVRLAGETLAEMPKLPPYQAPTLNIICRYLSAVLNEHKNDPNNLFECF